MQLSRPPRSLLLGRRESLAPLLGSDRLSRRDRGRGARGERLQQPFVWPAKPCPAGRLVPSDKHTQGLSVEHQRHDQTVLGARYWTPQAKGFGIAVDQRLIRLRAVAVAALTMPNNESQATKALAVIPGADATQCAHWLRGDQIGVPYLQPLRPDRLGEFLVNRTLEELPELLMDLVRATGMAHLTRMLTVLSRAATYSSVHSR